MKSLWFVIVGSSLALVMGCSTTGKHINARSAHLNSQELIALQKIAPCVAVSGGEDVILNVDDFYRKGHSKLTKEGKFKMASLTTVLTKYPSQRLTLLVYTDDGSSADAAMKMTQRRAQVLKKQMLKDGILADNLTAFGRGFNEPVAPNDSPENRAKNRRIELEIMP